MWPKLIIFIIAITLAITQAYILLSPTATAVGGVGDIVFDPSNYSQNLRIAAQTLKTNLDSATQLANQAVQLANEARNLTRFPVDFWNRAQAQYEQLKALTQGNASLGEFMQKVDSQFSSLYPGYVAVTNYGDAFKTWTDNTLQMANGVFSTVEKQRQIVISTTDRTQEIVASSAAGDGLTQQIQSQVSLSAQMVNQLQQLQMLQAQESTLQAAFIASQVQDRASERKAVDDWLTQSRSYKFH